MHNLHLKFNKILALVKDTLQNHLDKTGNVPKVGANPKFSDAKVIALSLMAECLMIDSENYLFKILHSQHKQHFPNLISRSAYNRRRRRLLTQTTYLRQQLVEKLIPWEDTFVVDSMPLPISQFARAKRTRICKESYETAPDFGFCAAQQITCFGYKLHSICSIDGVVSSFDLSPASVADIHYLQDIRSRYPGCLLLGDKAYLNHELQLELFETNRLKLHTPMRRNQKDYVRQPALFRKVRKRIETAFSQLCDQFNMQRNYAKTFEGLMTRIIAKISGFTLLQYLNKFEFNNKLNHVKHALI